jgi:hypothetical protein
MSQSDYLKYRGRCKELCDQAIKSDPSLILVRGYYFDPIWNKEEQHWWTKREDGSIYDPSAKQFPSKGHGIYAEFDGFVTCEECGKVMPESESKMCGKFPVCSTKCALSLVGL